ncbi:MAG: hypothetical protein ACON4Z_07735, partial [Planctomycetota bacterium]
TAPSPGPATATVGPGGVRGCLEAAHRSARTEEQRAVVSLRGAEGASLTLRLPDGPHACVLVIDGRVERPGAREKKF